MGRTPEAQLAINATLELLKDQPRTFSLSPTTLELSKRELENAPTSSYDLRASTLRLPPIFDPEHMAHLVYEKIKPAGILSTQTLKPAPLSLTGREVDFLTELLVPYTKEDKEEWVEARTAGSMADYMRKFPDASPEELHAYEAHTSTHAKFQMGMLEEAAREIHDGFEDSGGKRRQSYIKREELFESLDRKPKDI